MLQVIGTEKEEGLVTGAKANRKNSAELLLKKTRSETKFQIFFIILKSLRKKKIYRSKAHIHLNQRKQETSKSF